MPSAVAGRERLATLSLWALSAGGDMIPAHRLWCLLLMATVLAEDWMLHTPGGGPLDSRCPCMTPRLCPRIFGDSALDIRHFGRIPICSDSRQVRCCGASSSVRVPGAPGHVDGEQEAGENITQQTSPEQHANSAQTTSPSVLHEASITEKQHRGIAGSEDSSNGFNTTADTKNGLNIHPEENTDCSKCQQTENIQSSEELQKYSSNRDQSGGITVFPWNVAGTYDPTELEDTYLIYPEDGDDNDTDAWNWNMSDGDLLLSHKAELQSSEPDYKNSTTLTETPKASSIIERMFPEKEYLVASHSEYNGMQGRKGMKEDLEDQENDDGEESINDENDDSSGHNNRTNEHQAESPAHGHVLTHRVQNVPKRSFVSENLKMRISRLATREGRPGPRANTAADKLQSTDSRYHAGQISSQPFYAMKVTEEHMRTARNRSPAPSVGRVTARARSRSNIKNATEISEAPTAIPCTSRIQNTFSHQFDGNCSEGTVTDTNVSQRDGRLRQGSVPSPTQRRGSEATSQHSREISATKLTDAEASQTSKSDHDGIVETIYPEVRRNITETLQGTFGARTRTRDRPRSFQMSPSYGDTKTDSGTGSVTTKFVYNQQTGQGVTEHHPVTSLGSDARQSLKGDISVEGAGLINVVGPIPKGFTDPATLQNTGSVNQRGPLFHLPYNIQPQPFLNQISNSKVPQISVSVAPPSSGVSSFSPDMSVFHRPQTQSFHQHHVLGHAGNRSPQKYIQTVIATPTANIANFDRHKWQGHRQNQLPSIQEADFDAPQVPSPLIAQTFNLPSTHNLADFNKPLLFRLPTPTPPTQVPVAAVHSSLDDETTKAKIISLPQTSPLQKFLRFPDQQLKQLGQKESFMSLSAQGSQLSSKLPEEDRPAPQFALHQQDARRHSAQLEYTKKLQEYFQQLQNYYSQQPHT